jgi:hypothetical protein
MMYIRRASWFCFLLLAFFSGQPLQAQTRETLSFSVQAYDKLLSQLTPGQEDVLVGDMRFKVEKLLAWRNLLDDKLHNRLVTKGAFDFSSTTPWPAGVVPYRYDASFPDSVKVDFEAAIREWQISASLNFVLRTSTKGNHLLIKFTGYEPDAAMDSWIGLKGGAQVLNVAGWEVMIDCAHELGHALGMAHEQSRSDRDDWVTVITGNLVDPKDVNYAIVPNPPSSINRTAYDYDSLMHYPRSALPMTKPDMISILAKSPNESWSDGLGPQEIGQKSYLSPGDRAAMAGQYGAPLKIGGRIADAANTPLAGVQVTLSGGATYRGPNPISTDASGNYEFIGIPRNSGTYTLAPSQPGTSFTEASRIATVVTGSHGAVDFTSVDSAPPGLTITTPAVSGVYATLSAATGTASDTVGLREVRVALARTADLVWWNFRDGVWGSTTFDWATSVRIAAGTASWSANLPTLAVGGYQTHVQSVDFADNASPWRFRHFFIDPEPPVVTVTEPANNSFIPEFTILRGTASDGAGTGLTNGIVQFTLNQNGDFWTGFNWKPNTTAQDPDVLLFAHVIGGVWGYNNVPEGSAERAGSYAVSVFARDNAGNTSVPVSGVTSVQFSVDNDPPSVAITSPATGSTLSNLTAITGTMDDSRGVVSVRVYLLRYADNAFWDGTAWAGGGSAILPVSINANNGTWTTTGPLPSVNTMNPANRLTNGGYDIIAYAVDAAGNQRRIDSVITIEFYLPLTYTRGSFSDLIPSNNNELWDNPANWNPAGVPGDQELAIVNNFNPQITGTRTVRRLALSGGTISGGTLSIPAQGSLDWSGGVLAAHLVVNEGAAFNITGAAAKTMTPNTVIDNDGTALWTGAGDLLGAYGSVFNNNGALMVQNDSVLYNNTGGSPSPAFNNYGIFQKTVATNVTGISAANGGWIFNHFGTLNVQTGVVSFQGQANILDGSVFSGAGVTRIDSGATTVFGTNSLAGGTVELAGGVLVGTNLFSGPGNFHWSNGTIAGNNSIAAGANLLIKGDATKTLTGSLNNGGAGVWTGAGDINFRYGSVFNNSGTFTALNDAQFYNNTGGSPIPVFINRGTFTKSTGVNTTAFALANGGVAFNNLGAVNVQSGVLALGGGGASSNSSFNTASGARVDIIGGTHTWTGGISFSGLGRTRMTGGAITLGGGNNTINSGATLEVGGGSLDGSGSLTGPGTLNWTGGNIAASLNLQPTLTFGISGENNKGLLGAINNAGTAIWTGAGQIFGRYGGALTNTGTFNIQNDSQFYNNTGGSPTPVFHNAGTVRKTGATGLTVIAAANGGWIFNNSGLLDIQTGVLSSLTQFNLNDGGRFSGSGITRVDGAAATMNGNNNIAAGGTFEVANGALNGAGAFHGPGTFVWSGGVVAGTIGVGTDGNLAISGSDPKTLFGVLSNAGTGVWTGAGDVNCRYDSVFNNSGTFTALNNAQFFNNTGGSPAPAFFNRGFFTKSTGANTTAFPPANGGVAFHNLGTVDTQSGVLALGGGGTSSNATFTARTGARIEFPSGAPFFNGGLSFGGAGITRVNGAGVTSLGGTNTVLAGGTFEVAGGALAGQAGFAGPGTFGWTGGNIAATLNLQPNLTFILSGDADKTLGGGTLNNAGNITWTGAGNLSAAYAGVINNAGTFNIQNDSRFFNYTGGSPTPAFNNSGTVRKTIATGQTIIQPDNGGWIFNNAGLIDIQTGVLSARSQFNLNAGGSYSGAGTTRSDGGTATINGTSAILSTGSFELASGTFNGTGTFNGPGAFAWTGGTFGAVLTIGSTASLLITGNTDRTFAGTINNAGTATWINNATLNVSYSSVFNNSGTFLAQNEGQFYNSTGGSPSPAFNNSGVLRKTTLTTTTFANANGGINFNNSGTVDLHAGTLAINAGYFPSATSQLKVVLAGPIPATQFGRELFPGHASLAGSLQVTLSNGFSPTNGSTFDIVGYASRTGQFASTQLPALPPGLGWKVDYNPNAVTLRVAPSDTTPTPPPAMLANGHFQATFSGPAGSAAIFQASTNLINWVSLMTNSPFTGTFLFDDGAAMKFTNRFYQILIVP